MLATTKIALIRKRKVIPIRNILYGMLLFLFLWTGCNTPDGGEVQANESSLELEECGLDTGPCNSVYEFPDGYSLPKQAIESLMHQYPDMDYYVIVTKEGCGGCSTYLGQYLYHYKPSVDILLLVSEIYYNKMSNYRRLRFEDNIRVVLISDDSLGVFKEHPAPIIINRTEERDGTEKFKVYLNDNPPIFRERLEAILTGLQSSSPKL